MDQERWTEVDRYITERVLPADPALEAALAASDAAGLPAIQVSPNMGKLLQLLAQSIGARGILEIGTLGGYSTIWLARAVTPGGRVVTLELNSAFAEVARSNLARAGLAARVEVRIGPALETLPLLAAEASGPFDLIFIDADKESTAEYFRWALKLSRRGSLIVVDNVVREGTLIDEDRRDAHIRGIRDFYELAAAEPRVSMTAIQTVGIKGYDGFAVALVAVEAAQQYARPALGEDAAEFPAGDDENAFLEEEEEGEADVSGIGGSDKN
jgi:predicted O-methyltransferase YrrM